MARVRIEYTPSEVVTYNTPERFLAEDRDTGFGIHVMNQNVQIVGYSAERDQFDSYGFFERRHQLTIEMLRDLLAAYERRTIYDR